MDKTTILTLKEVKKEVSRYAAHPNSESLQDILYVTCPLTPIERAEVVKELLALSDYHGLSKSELNAEIKRLLKTAEDTPFFEGKELKPLRVVNVLRESNVYLTTIVDKQLRIYEDGVYRKDDIRETAREVIQLLNDDVTRGGIDGVISLLQDLTMCDIPIHTDWLNFKNGRFCLDSWELLEHSPEYRSIVQMPVEYNPDAKCPEFDKFLPSVLPQEDDQFLLLQLMGYSMLQDLRFGKIVYLYGPTHTGKSTIFKVLRALLGEDNTAALTWHALDNEDRRFSRAGLVGKLANLSGDLSSKYLAGDSQIKKISVGDAIDVEFKGVQSFTVEQYCTLWASGNSLPVSHDRTDAWYERLILLPFSQQHRGKEADKHLPKRLTQPGQGTHCLKAGETCASSQSAFPRKRLTSAPQRDHKQPSKCLSQRSHLGHGANHSQDTSTADQKV